ncbi:MAG: M20/M25/M40 family metallo-hydrolase, partial [Bacteroidota bacterium]
MEYSKTAIRLLQSMISTPSFSKEEEQVADLLETFLISRNIRIERFQNNLLAIPFHYDKRKSNILLNSHIDTVKPNSGYTQDPFDPIIQDGKLYGLGSNDAGASLVALIMCFLHYEKIEDLPFNLILGISAEEEISGRNGMELLLQNMPKIEMAIVGEPTQLRMAIEERGLMVIDAIAEGIAGHAARNE